MRKKPEPWMLFLLLFVLFLFVMSFYLVDAATGKAAERAAPRFGGGQDVTRQVCVDTATTTRSLLFDGDEIMVGPVIATDPNGDTVSHSLGRAGDSPAYAFFDIATSTGQLSVSPIGADDDVGLGIGLYDLRVVASDGGLVQGEVGVTVQVRKIASRAGDGTCP